jgi:hypothetical protein
MSIPDVSRWIKTKSLYSGSTSLWFLNVAGWQEVKGGLPKVQTNLAYKDGDEDGDVAPQPFIAMMQSLLRALDRHDLLPGLPMERALLGNWSAVIFNSVSKYPVRASSA